MGKNNHILGACTGALLLLTTGCVSDVGYLFSVVSGGINVLTHTVPIEEVLAGNTLTQEEESKLELVPDTRQYAEDVIGLNVGDSYTRFYDTSGQPLSYSLSASRAEAFDSVEWWFPIVGGIDRLGFFESEAAEAKAEELSAQGFDVYTYEPVAFSLLGYIPDPVTSPMLDLEPIQLMEVLFHELLHSTIYRAGDSTFSEGLAGFVGQTAAVEYYSLRFPGDPDTVEAYIAAQQDARRFNDFILDLYDQLDEFYSSDSTSEEKLDGREAIFQAARDRFVDEILLFMHDPGHYEWVRTLPTNNALLMTLRRYNFNLELFEQVYRATGDDWAVAQEVFREAASSADPYEYMLDWLPEQGM